MLHVFQFVSHLIPVVLGVEQRNEIVHVEVFDNHVVDTFGFDAGMCTSEFYFADFLEDLLVFFVKHIFVHEESDDSVGEAVPHLAREGAGNEATNHETPSREAGKVVCTAATEELAEEVDLVTHGEEIEETALVVVVTHTALKDPLDILLGMLLEPGVDDGCGLFGLVLKIAADETSEFADVGDIGYLAGGDNLLVFLVE